MIDSDFFKKLDCSRFNLNISIGVDSLYGRKESFVELSDFVSFFKNFCNFLYEDVYNSKVNYKSLGASPTGEFYFGFVKDSVKNLFCSLDVSPVFINDIFFTDTFCSDYIGKDNDIVKGYSLDDVFNFVMLAFHEGRHLEQEMFFKDKDFDNSLTVVVPSAINELLNPDHYSFKRDNKFVNYYNCPMEIDAQAVGLRRAFGFFKSLVPDFDFKSVVIDIGTSDERVSHIFDKDADDIFCEINRVYDEVFIDSLSKSDICYNYLYACGSIRKPNNFYRGCLSSRFSRFVFDIFGRKNVRTDLVLNNIFNDLSSLVIDTRLSEIAINSFKSPIGDCNNFKKVIDKVNSSYDVLKESAKCHLLSGFEKKTIRCS